MAMPTKEEFEEYLKILADYEIDSLLNLLYRRNFDQDELMRIFEILNTLVAIAIANHPIA